MKGQRLEMAVGEGGCNREGNENEKNKMEGEENEKNIMEAVMSLRRSLESIPPYLAITVKAGRVLSSILVMLSWRNHASTIQFIQEEIVGQRSISYR